MKMRAFCLGLCLLAGQALAQEGRDISMQFSEIRLPDLVRLLFTDILGKNYVLDKEVLESPEILTINIKYMSPAQLETHLLEIIQRRGFKVDCRQGFCHVAKRPEAAQEAPRAFYVYRPRHRSVPYLLALVGPLYPPQSFTTQRQIDNPGPETQKAGNSTGHETGTNATSLIDKGNLDTLVYQGSPQEITRLESLLQQLDQAAAEVIVKASVFEVRQTRQESSAVSLALGLLKSASGLGITITQDTSNGNAVKIKAGDVSAVWSALSSDSRFRLFSAPTIRIRSGNTAKFMAGSEVPVLASTTTTTTGTVQSVEYKSSGVILELTPQVRPGGTELQIAQEVSSFTATTNGVNNSPTLLKRELTTQITAHDEEIILLGGLEETTRTDGQAGLSFLPAWMKGSSEGEDRTEIMMILNVQRI
ncbi:MAG: hypothetical protein LWW84_14390 [Azovibrio sp.]|nr:hypothetical protein [Azovibrio sp.]